LIRRIPFHLSIFFAHDTEGTVIVLLFEVREFMAEAAKTRDQPKPRRTTLNKSPRAANLSGPGAIQSRPPECYAEDVLSPQKSYEISVQQFRRSAIAQAQAVGAPGNFKRFDSQFGNYLVPVIPTHLVNRSQLSPTEGGAMVPSSLTPK